MLGVSILISQLLGSPLYLVNKNQYYTWIAQTKSHFAVLIIFITQLWSPTTVVVSGDESVKDQVRRLKDSVGVELAFPGRILLIANHQVFFLFSYLIVATCQTNMKFLSILGYNRGVYWGVFKVHDRITSEKCYLICK